MNPPPSQLINQIRAFLAQIGIQTREQALPEPTFLPGLLIQDGVLLIDSQRLAYPGDILHEAGHIAVSEPAQRGQLSGNITENRPEKAGEEMAVLLWSYAACLHLDMELRIVSFGRIQRPERVAHRAVHPGQLYRFAPAGVDGPATDAFARAACRRLSRHDPVATYVGTQRIRHANGCWLSLRAAGPAGIRYHPIKRMD